MRFRLLGVVAMLGRSVFLPYAILAAVACVGMPAAADCVDAGTTREGMAYLISHGMPGFDSWTAPATPTFSDVPTSYWAYKEIEFALAHSIANGYADGTYRPSFAVDRGQMAVYLARAIAGGDANVPSFTGTPTFADVGITHWAIKYVEYLAAQIGAENIQSSPGIFAPTAVMTNNTAVQWIQLGLGASGDPCALPGAVPIEPEHPEGWPEIVFAKQLAGVYQLYGVMADGTGLDGLYPWPAGASCTRPVWSPDRRFVAYYSYNREPGEMGVYCLDLVTGEDQLLASGGELFPSQWSPDGTRLLLQGGEALGSSIFRVDSDGSNLVLLSAGGPDDGSESDPRWSPDGSKVFFCSDRDAPFTAAGRHIWVMNPDGSGQTKLTTGTGPYDSPRPSPDGELVAYTHAGHIWTIQPDGSGISQLTSSGSADCLAVDSSSYDCWSPDGSIILFARDELDPLWLQVYRMDREGGGQTRISPGIIADEYPCDWSPDGARVIFFATTGSLYTMASDGSGPQQLVYGDSRDPTWRAAGIRRVYLPRVTAEPDANLTLPLNVDTCLGIAGFQGRVDFDPAILECTGVQKGTLLPGSWAMLSPNIDNTNGNVRFIAYDAGAQGLPAGHGQMFRLLFHVKTTAPPGATSALHFTQCLISDDMGDPILMTPVDGAVSTPTADYQLSISGTHGYVEVDGTPQSLPYTSTFPSGSEVSLHAVADAGYQFTQWSGDLQSAANPTTVVMDSPKSITAEFAVEPTCTLTITGSNGQVSVSCSDPHSLPWSEQLPAGPYPVRLDAVPDPGYAFWYWSGDYSSSSAYICPTVPASGGLYLEAHFRLLPYTLSLDKTGEGYIAVDGQGWWLPAQLTLDVGSEPELEAIPADEHWFFDHWSGDLTGAVNPSSLLMNSDKSVTANFLLHTLTLTIGADPSVVWSGGQSQLSAQASDNLAHSMSMYWRDMVALEPFLTSSLDGGVPSDIALRGDYAYCAARGALTVYDVSDPAAPERVGVCDVQGNGRRIALSPGGDYAYVGTQQHGVRVVSVADPAAPTEIGLCEGLDGAGAVAVSADYLYAWGSAYNQGRLAVYSLATPAAPVLLNEVAAEERPWLGGIAVYDQYLYLAGYQLSVFTLYSPSEPVLTNVLYGVGSNTIAVHGMYAYIGRHELQVIQFYSPTEPVLANSLPVSGRIEQITVSGDYAYVADSLNGVRVFDLSDPGNPVEVALASSPASAWAVAAAGDNLYVGGDKGLSVLDVSNPPSLVEVAADLTFGSTRQTVVVGRYAYVAALGAGLRVIDLEAPGGPSVVAGYAVPGRCLMSLAASGSYVYGGLGGIGLAVFDVSDPTLPQLVSVWESGETSGCPSDAAVYGHYVIIPHGCCGYLHVIDVTDPANPTEAAQCDLSRFSCCIRLSVAGTTLYTSLYDWGYSAYLDVIDISEPRFPARVATRPFPMAADEYGASIATLGSSGLMTSGSVAYTLDLSNPFNPAPVGSTGLGATALDSTMSDGKAYIAASTGAGTMLRVLDISDPAIPTIVGTYEGAGALWWGPTVSSAGDQVLFSDTGWGLEVFDVGSTVDQPMGSFSPSQFAEDPVYTAPENDSDQNLSIILEATATCDADPRLQATATTTLTVTPCATLGGVSAQGAPGDSARVPVVLDLRSLEADRFAFSVAVTPVPGAPALAGALGFEAAPGIPTPGLVVPSGGNISVAWLSPLAQPITGSVYLGDLLVPLATSAELGDAYDVCMLSVGASLGVDEICVQTGDCAVLTSCGRLLVSDGYPAGSDQNSDGDACDFGEFGNDDLTWGDVITVFDAWAIPGSFPCDAGTWRVYAMDSYPRDPQGAPGGDGAITWGDIITTFDRFANPMLPRPWRTVCDPMVPTTAASGGEKTALSRAAASAAPVITIAGGSGETGSAVRLRVTLDLAGQQADRAAFAVEITPIGNAGVAAITGFEAAAGRPQPMVSSAADGLAVAWLSPLPSALSGTASLGDLLVALPSSAKAGDAWRLRLTAVGASLGEDELDPAVVAGADATLTALAPAPHDVAVKLQAPSKVKAGDSKRFTIEVENHTKTVESITVRLLKGGQVLQSWSIELGAKERRRLQTDYVFTEQDKPSIEFRAEAVLAKDSNPRDNTSAATVSVR